MHLLPVPIMASALLVAASLVFGQEQPPQEMLSGKIVEMIPPYWSVGEMPITASVNLSDPVEPRIKQRLEVGRDGEQRFGGSGPWV
jgi:hypothetical protein